MNKSTLAIAVVVIQTPRDACLSYGLASRGTGGSFRGNSRRGGASNAKLSHLATYDLSLHVGRAWIKERVVS